MFPYEVQIFFAWALALPCVLAWTIRDMRRYPRQRWHLAGLLCVALPGALIAGELSITLGSAYLRGRELRVVPYELVGVLLSCLWCVVGPGILLGVVVAPSDQAPRRALTAAHAVLWVLTTLVATAAAVRV